MDGRKVVAATALLLALGAPAAYAAPGVTVSQVSSLKGTSGTLTGKVVNETGHGEAHDAHRAPAAPRHQARARRQHAGARSRRTARRTTA